MLVTALTKRLAEDLSAYIQEAGFRGRYLHSEIQTLERVEILQDLRKGEFDVLIGINLLREGLDLPEVSLVCDPRRRQGRLPAQRTSLVQTIGRAARNVNAKVILYADTSRRRCNWRSTKPIAAVAPRRLLTTPRTASRR